MVCFFKLKGHFLSLLVLHFISSIFAFDTHSGSPVFTSEADLQADENRRLYAISIPSAYNSAPSNSYKGSVYSSPTLGSNSFNIHSSSPKPPPHPPSNVASWNGAGLRLIVSGPVQDHSSRPVPANDYYHYDSKAPSEYYNPYGRVSDDTRKPYSRNSNRDSPLYNRGSHQPVVQQPRPPPSFYYPKSQSDDQAYYSDYSDVDYLTDHQNEEWENNPIEHPTNDDSIDNVEHNEYDYWDDKSNDSRDDYSTFTDYQVNSDSKQQPKNKENTREIASIVKTKDTGGSKTRHEVPIYHRREKKQPPVTKLSDSYYEDYDDNYYDEIQDTNDGRTYNSNLEDHEMPTLNSDEKRKFTNINSSPKPLTVVKKPSTEKPTFSSTTSELSTSTEKDLPPITTTTQQQTELPSTTVRVETTSKTSSSTLLPTGPHPYKKSGNTIISLSEILQSIDLSLPQFLVQLKLHDSNLKQFTGKLQSKALTKNEFKKARGNVGKLLKILNEEDGAADLSTTTKRPTTVIQYKTSSWSPFQSTTKKPKIIYRKPTPRTKETTTITKIESTTEDKIILSSSSTTVKPSTRKPKTFGFKPTVIVTNIGLDEKASNISVAKSIDEPNKIEEKENIPNSKTEEESEESMEIYKPYRPRESWRDRMQHNRNMVSSRTGTTTIRPKVRPDYNYNGGGTKFVSFSDEKKQASGGKNSEKALHVNSDSSRNVNERISSIIGLVEGTDYNHPRYDNDPHSLNIATRSAIMAASVLGGVALAVFATILVIVMYKNHSNKKRLRRIPFSVSLSSDDSTSSTPAIYSKRPRYGVTVHRSSKQSDFWGTLRKKFDPYSLDNASSSASYYY